MENADPMRQFLLGPPPAEADERPRNAFGALVGFGEAKKAHCAAEDRAAALASEYLEYHDGRAPFPAFCSKLLDAVGRPIETMRHWLMVNGVREVAGRKPLPTDARLATMWLAGDPECRLRYTDDAMCEANAQPESTLEVIRLGMAAEQAEVTALCREFFSKMETELQAANEKDGGQ